MGRKTARKDGQLDKGGNAGPSTAVARHRRAAFARDDKLKRVRSGRDDKPIYTRGNAGSCSLAPGSLLIERQGTSADHWRELSQPASTGKVGLEIAGVAKQDCVQASRARALYIFAAIIEEKSLLGPHA